MAVGKTIGLDADRVADDALGRESPAVHARRHVLDDDARASILERDWLHVGCGHGADSSGSSTSRPSGGRRRLIDWKRPCAATGTLFTPPKLPTPLPP